MTGRKEVDSDTCRRKEKGVERRVRGYCELQLQSTRTKVVFACSEVNEKARRKEQREPSDSSRTLFCQRKPPPKESRTSSRIVSRSFQDDLYAPNEKLLVSIRA
jgi:hypothetical protein